MNKTFTVNEIAEYLNVSTDSIYTMVREKQIPHVRIRRRIIFIDEIVEQWLKDQCNSR
ncbi:helix-turn-helix domain-containing protein [Paenibacillus sp. FSL R7-0204]|uniref:excisionase family DNA-binding protein n=1 Tax=Paenibacillus TaxID=44249 RepID=UPI001AE125F3|nr:helix-turn-helix domain-containing protein [Paenibacillus albidus]MBT2293717.1 excisionase family DNA-binding protein [Paenibacillus albidus]